MSKIVERTLDFFELFAREKRPLSLSDATRLLGIPASSGHDVIRALEARGYLYETAPRAGYYPTRRLFDLAAVIADHDSIVARARPMMEETSQGLGETVTLTKATGMRMLYLFVVEPEDPVRFSVRAGTETLSLHGTSAGKALLGSLSDDALADWLRRTDLVRHTHRTLVTSAKLVADLDRSRRRGWYLNDEESREGVSTLSGSFVWNGALHAFTVAGPANRMRTKLAKVGERIRDACRLLGEPEDQAHS